MKKQKFMRLSAFTSAPALENSFSSPVGFQGEISVVFRGKAVSIHGWDGNSWTTIYIWNGIDPQFKFENTYQNYYLKSLTGSQESMGVSFFSVGKIVNSTPQFAGINRSTKLYDIEEVPVYTASDAGKLLTIMSNGSLRWLLATESFNVEGGGESPVPNPYTANWIEESANLIIGANSGDSVSNGILSTATRSSTTFHLNKTSYFDLDNYAASPTKTATYSIWFRKTGDTYVNGNISNTSFPVFSHQTLYRALAVKIMNNNQVVLGGEIAYPSNYGPTIGTLSEDINIGNWHHVVLSFSINGSGKTEVNAVIDGVAQTAYIDPAALDIGRVGSNLNTMIGADNLKSFSTGDFDSFEISKGTALSVSQMQSLYNAGRGTMSIEEASTL